MKHGAIYLRLSKDDNGKNESESIANQRHLLLQYAETNAIPVRFEFSDDGITGTTQNRRGLQNMYRAIEDGLIDTVLVKDLSRLSRNFIHTGEFLSMTALILHSPHRLMTYLQFEQYWMTGMRGIFRGRCAQQYTPNKKPDFAQSPICLLDISATVQKF